ncbi:hypothetical protein [Mangrovihabitans endophyticus]|uniref:Uncharacterized protein n=1 Tax=Mangrovihabitans endophyticus TaxID=1751298 RepID=A0A8J3FPF5_9ACTN|nr:hypothetical protein [Mangrovihabitans endophyticus]GGK99042.1 hypothetical protein GCM10012284_36840 [Mangrovihabitans endophyticus]
MPVVAVLTFALAWWMAGYLLGRDTGRPVSARAAAALIAYALGVAAWTVAPGGTSAQILLCLPALGWAAAAVALVSDDVPERRQIERGTLVLSAIFLVMIVALPGAGRLVALAPLIGGVVVMWRFRDAVAPHRLPAAVATAAALYGVALVVVLGPADLGHPVLALAAMGLDLLVLGYLAAVADAVDAGERLGPDLRRSAVGAVVAILACGGPATLTMLAAPDRGTVVILQFVLVAVVLTAIGPAAHLRRGLDRIAFLHDDHLRRDRAALMLLAEALPRRASRHRLATLTESEFHRHTRRALENFGNPGRLLRSPLIDLPAVDRRLAGQAAKPLARAMELSAVLRDGVTRLKPDGVFGTTDLWRHYNALHYCCVRGLRPYDRWPSTEGLDRDALRALEWFRGEVPRRTMQRWQREGARQVADRLWADLTRADPRWRGRASVSAPPTRAE